MKSVSGEIICAQVKSSRTNYFPFFYISPILYGALLVGIYSLCQRENLRMLTFGHSLKNMERLSSELTYEVTLEEKGIFQWVTQIPHYSLPQYESFPIGNFLRGDPNHQLGYTFSSNPAKLWEINSGKWLNKKETFIWSKSSPDLNSYLINFLLNIANKMAQKKLVEFSWALFKVPLPPMLICDFLNEETSLSKKLKILSKTSVFQFFIKSLIKLWKRVRHFWKILGVLCCLFFFNGSGGV